MSAVVEHPDKSKMVSKVAAEFAISKLPSNEEAAVALRDKYADLPAADTRVGYEAHRTALNELVKLRTGIEARRKELKAESLERGRAIDAFAKWATEVIERIEEPIRKAKQVVD